MQKTLLALLVLIFSCTSLNTTNAQDKKSKTDKSKKSKDAPDPSVTTGTVTIDGNAIAYTATAGEMIIKDSDGKEMAKVFYVSYAKDDAKDKSKRPITFAFNGGPGACSVWLHLGMLGPQRIAFDDDGYYNNGPPYELINNEFSLLDVSDIVMVDPVSTGYSRPVEGKKKQQFHGFSEDIESVGNFIWTFCTENNRWSSPKYLLGESYGTTRAAGLSGHLQTRYGMYLNGIILVSSVLDFQTIRFNINNDLPYILYLPTYCATAWYHKKLDSKLQKDLAKTLKEVQDFTENEYTLALFKGSALSEKERKAVIEKYSKFTGLSKEYIDRSNLRIGQSGFAKELLRDDQRTLGRFDSRYQGIDRTHAGSRATYDPSLSALRGPFSTLIQQYIRENLKYESDLKYEIFGNVHPWNYSQFENSYVNSAETLRSAMTRNPNLKVFVASGHYDLATPYYATDYTINHLGLDKSLQDNLTIEYYAAGHMMYVHKDSLEKIKKDLLGFYGN